MRTIGATFLFGCLAALPVTAGGQTSILPPTATLNPLNDAAMARKDPPRGDALAARREVAPVVHGGEHGRHGEGRASHGRTCLAQAEARETVAAHRLMDPLQAMRIGRQQGDALNAKLCRWPPEEFVYEIDVLRRDGRLLRLFMNAQNGEALAGPPQALQTTQGAPNGGHPADRDR